jgi:hypothetical protein
MVDEVAQPLARLAGRELQTGDEDPVFASALGGHLDPSALRRRFVDAVRRAGLRTLPFHSLRHFFGSMAVNKASLVQVQRGWATPISRPPPATCTTAPNATTPPSSPTPSGPPPTPLSTVRPCRILLASSAVSGNRTRSLAETESIHDVPIGHGADDRDLARRPTDPIASHTQPSPTSSNATRQSSQTTLGHTLQPTPHTCAHATSRLPNPLKNQPLPLPLHRHSTRRLHSSRPPPALLLYLSSLLLLRLFTPLSLSSLHRSTVHPSLHQLLPVPGPDPSRLPLWWLGGVRARHRPHTPVNTGISYGRAIHTAVHTLVPHPCSQLRLFDRRRELRTAADPTASTGFAITSTAPFRSRPVACVAT